ncbi:hypothetical protein [Halobellus sp. EA9]|uniref:hypothetical protein n=1 Tax=Halobellus sp. EA9 TaxID=3421647 RepID=UPI003EBAF576
MASRSDSTATTDAPAATDSVASVLADADFVRLVARADGDALAAAGLLARALRDLDVPFQARVDALGADAPTTDEGVLLAVGADRSDADVAVAPTGADPASARAFDIASTLVGDAPDLGLALAGVVAGGAHPGSVAGSLVERAEASGAIERRPGVAVPTDDVVDGLTHSTLWHAPVSGDAAAVADLLGPYADDAGAADDDERPRTVASLVALTVAGDDAGTPRGAEAVERALRPHATPEGPLATIGGFADVLNAVARERPGTGVALALCHGGRDAALDAWRDHAGAVHAALREAHTGRYDGVFAVRADVGGDADAPGADSRTAGRLATLARLARDFRSPEPFVIALGDDVAALSAVESGASDAADTLAAEFGAGPTPAWTGTATDAVVRVDPDAADADVIAAARDATRTTRADRTPESEGSR